MSYSPKLSSGFTFAKNRSAFISPQSGMCSFCTQDCTGTCELAHRRPFWGRKRYTPRRPETIKSHRKKTIRSIFPTLTLMAGCLAPRGPVKPRTMATIFNVNLERTYGRLQPGSNGHARHPSGTDQIKLARITFPERPWPA